MKLIIGIISSLLILSGCSTNQKIDTTPEPSISWQKHAQNMLLLLEWDARAQVAIKVNNKTQKAKMHWQQRNKQYDIAFSGPFGQSGPKLSGDQNSATLHIPKEAPLTGPNTSALLQERLGWQLPVKNAKYWVLGIPSPSSESTVLLKNERLASLTQDGWNINYIDYKAVGSNFLPSKIIISRDNLNLLLVIYKWDIDLQLAEK
ncbi:MAG: outer membrane lipoprotein LolB [Oceanospirillaceae bacterium]|jgi:outer membrane lipoprotein LolB